MPRELQEDQSKPRTRGQEQQLDDWQKKRKLQRQPLSPNQVNPLQPFNKWKTQVFSRQSLLDPAEQQQPHLQSSMKAKTKTKNLRTFSEKVQSQEVEARILGH